MSILAQVVLVCALLGAPGPQTPTSADAPVVRPANAQGIQDPTTDPALRAVRAEVEALRKAAEQAETAAPDEAARLRARVDLVTQLLLVLIRQQEQLYLQNQALLAALGSVGPPPASGRAGSAPPAPAPGSVSVRRAPTAALAAGHPAGPLFGKRGGGKLHRPRCPAGERIRLGDRVVFASYAQAVVAGFQPCKICHPER